MRYLWEASNGKFSVCVKCGKWIHGRSRKVKRGTLRMGRDFVCGRCKKQADGLGENGARFLLLIIVLWDRVNTTSGCEAPVTARARIAWEKFKE